MTKMRQRSFSIAVVLLLLAGGSPAWALDPVYSNFLGEAIRGYDPVAYFTAGKPVEGESRFSQRYMGANWHFASAENRQRFIDNPEQYAPQYGGYCAWAVSQGYTASIDPDAWAIVDGKLYLNYSKSVQSQWQQDTAGNIARADANWPGLLE